MTDDTTRPGTSPDDTARPGTRPDDETRPGDLTPDEWDRMVAAFRTAAPVGSAPPWLEQKVMAEIEALPERSALARAFDWLVRPAPIRVSPLLGGLVAAAFAAVLMIPGADAGPEVTTGAEGSVVYVQFILDAPGAATVAVAGDFSEWEPAFDLDDADGDGVWTGRVPVQPGVHSYMFLIDGSEWLTDPRADRYQDDGFGNQNAVLAVASGA